MKVGVLLKDQYPEVGGGYTFQDGILKAFLALRGESPHRFAFLCPTQRAGDALRAQGLAAQAEVISPAAHAERPAPRNPLTFGERIARRLGCRIVVPDAAPHAGDPLEEAARGAGIEFIWCVSHSQRAFDIPYLTVVWDLEHRTKPWFPEVSSQGEWRKREGWFGEELQRAAGVIAGTQAGRDQIARFFQVPEERIHVLPHPTPDLSSVAASVDAASVLLRYAIQRPYVFYPAQFWAHKNHVNLLHALVELERACGVALDAVFTGSDQGNLQHVRDVTAKLGLGGRVHFLGFVPVADLAGLYLRAHALAYVSLFGPENLPPLEAFSLGCPVVAAIVHGSDEQLGNAALLVDARDPREISNALARLTADAALRRALVERGKVRAARWTAKDYVQGVFRILDDFEAVRRTWR